MDYNGLPHTEDDVWADLTWLNSLLPDATRTNGKTRLAFAHSTGLDLDTLQPIDDTQDCNETCVCNHTHQSGPNPTAG